MIVVLNGPPSSGKDTIAEYLTEHHGYAEARFKTKLVQIALMISQISGFDWCTRYDDRELKETPWDRLGGLSQREYLIKISEDWVKPLHGESYFGDVLAQRIKYNYEGMDVILSDSGFVEEIKPVLALGISTLIVRLYREGCSFDGDSRDYLPVTLGVPTVVIHNNDTIDGAVYKILQAIKTGNLE